MTPLNLLQKYWKHVSFRKSQEAIIEAVLAKRNVIALLPTGGGKSVCYQIPGLLLDGVCIVVSPLIALMQDQVNSLNNKGIKSISITSKLSETEIITAFDNMIYGKIKFLYISPEKLQSELIQKKIAQLDVNLIAVDEAHCISEWGHDFRPSYLKINILKDIHPNVQMIALTATATSKVIADIEKHLNFKGSILFKETFNRSNLAYQVFETEDILFKLNRILTKIKAPAIIYVSTRGKTKEISDFLNLNDFKSSFYHGGMDSAEKEKSFNNWMSEKTNIMVATNAFGMGIDKDNVKVIVHIDIPYSIENYVQEAGRAGRNGKKAFSVILFNNGTILNFEKRIHKFIVTIPELKRIYKLLNQYLQIGYGEQPLNKMPFNLNAFSNKYQLNIIKTYNTIAMLEKEGIVALEQSFKRQSRVRFISTHQAVLSYVKNHSKTKNLIQFLLRNYGGIFENYIMINELQLSNVINLSKQEIVRQLNLLQKDGILNYHFQTDESNLLFLVMREDDLTINRIAKNLTQRNEIKIKKASDIVSYIKQNDSCRNKYLLEYFEEENFINCSICDYCLNQKKEKPNYEIISKNVLNLFNESEVIYAKEIVTLLSENDQDVLRAIQLLVEKKIIVKTSNNYYKINKK